MALTAESCAALLAEKLPPLRPKPRAFPFEVPASPMGGWTLWERDLMLASAACTSPFANGEVTFEEDKLGPPSRAYRKVWEALTVLGHHPQPGERCVDLGAGQECGVRFHGLLGPLANVRRSRLAYAGLPPDLRADQILAASSRWAQREPTPHSSMS